MIDPLMVEKMQWDEEQEKQERERWAEEQELKDMEWEARMGQEILREE